MTGICVPDHASARQFFRQRADCALSRRLGDPSERLKNLSKTAVERFSEARGYLPREVFSCVTLAAPSTRLRPLNITAEVLSEINFSAIRLKRPKKRQPEAALPR